MLATHAIHQELIRLTRIIETSDESHTWLTLTLPDALEFIDEMREIALIDQARGLRERVKGVPVGEAPVAKSVSVVEDTLVIGKVEPAEVLEGVEVEAKEATVKQKRNRNNKE